MLILYIMNGLLKPRRNWIIARDAKYDKYTGRFGSQDSNGIFKSNNKLFRYRETARWKQSTCSEVQCFVDKHNFKSTQNVWLREKLDFDLHLLCKKGTSLIRSVDYTNSGTHFVCVFCDPPVNIEHIWWPTHIYKNYFVAQTYSLHLPPPPS